MRDFFGSPRQALAYMYACRRGPEMRKVNLMGIASESFDSWTHVIIGAMIYGPKEQGCLGVEPGSEDDLAIQEWATSKGVERTGRLAYVERRLRELLREHDMLASPVSLQELTCDIRRDEESGMLYYKKRAKI